MSLVFIRIRKKLSCCTLPLSGHLALQAAARIDPLADAGHSKAREKAIDETIKELRRLYPDAFIELDALGLPAKSVKHKMRVELCFKGERHVLK